MATFEVEHSEGMHWVKVVLDDDDVRTRRGALNHMTGTLTMDVPLPTPLTWWVSLFSKESLLRPRYSGSGTVYLDASLAGYHRLEVSPGDRWILETHCFWAGDGEVLLSVHRERMLTSLWAGEGLFWYKTAVKGEGQVLLQVDGPVEERQLRDDRLVVDGRFVVAYTAGIRLSVRRPTKSFLAYFLSGQRAAYVYEGTGTILLVPVPYWRLRMQQEKAADQRSPTPA
jgi:uncharacterized protein (AIM24 family)